MDNAKLQDLATQFLAAKEAEKAATEHRRIIGLLLEDACPGEAEGTTNVKVGNLKVTVARKMTRKVADDALSTAWESLPPKVQAAFKWKAEVSITQLRAMQKLDDADLAVVNQYITTTPAATSVTVEITKEK